MMEIDVEAFHKKENCQWMEVYSFLDKVVYIPRKSRRGDNEYARVEAKKKGIIRETRIDSQPKGAKDMIISEHCLEYVRNPYKLLL